MVSSWQVYSAQSPAQNCPGLAPSTCRNRWSLSNRPTSGTPSPPQSHWVTLVAREMWWYLTRLSRMKSLGRCLWLAQHLFIIQRYCPSLQDQSKINSFADFLHFPTTTTTTTVSCAAEGRGSSTRREEIWNMIWKLIHDMHCIVSYRVYSLGVAIEVVATLAQEQELHTVQTVESKASGAVVPINLHVRENN